MKTVLLGNDTKSIIEKKISDVLSKYNINLEEGKISFNLEVNDENEKLVTVYLANGETHVIPFDEVLNIFESEVNDIRLQKRVQTVASAGFLSRAEGTVTDVYNGRNNKAKGNVSVAKKIIGMGHKTISEHDYLVLALEDVTPIIEQIIIGYRLTSFTIKSRRNVDFRTAGYYVPDFKGEDGKILKDNEELQGLYTKYMDSLFNKYGEFLDNEVPVEDARFILPYSYHSNIIMGCDCNELLRMTCDFLYGKNSHITEVHELGERLSGIIHEYVPYLVPALEAEKEKEYYKDQFGFLDELYNYTCDNYATIDFEFRDPLSYKSGELIDRPHLISYDNESLNKVLTSILMERYQLSYADAKKHLYLMTRVEDDLYSKMMKSLIKSKNQRELEQTSFSFEIPISLASLTHLTRHRMHSLLVPDFFPLWKMDNYVTPPAIEKSEYKGEYDEVFANNMLMIDEFKKHGVRDEDLVYFYLSGNACNVYTTMNARALMWISRMRCCNKAQWEIRDLVNQMVADVSKVSPLIGKNLGPYCKVEGFCPEGDDSCKKRNTSIVLKKDKK